MLLFCDGFDSYGSTADLITNRKWLSNVGWTWSATAGRLGGGGLLLPNTTGTIKMNVGQLGLAITSACACGFWFKASAAPAAAIRFLEYWDNLGTTFAGALGIATTGIPQLIQPNNTVTFVGTTNICDGQWHWIEWSYQPWNSASTHRCLVDSVSQWNTSIAFSNNGTINYGQFIVTSAMTINLSWPFFYNATAGNPVIPGSFPLGPQNIITLRPASDGTCTFGTVSAGTNHSAMVNNIAPDGDTTYVEGISGTGLQDLYNYSSITGTPTIAAVTVNTMLENPSGGTSNYQIACKSGATTSLEASATAGSTYAKMDMFALPTDPNTSAAWTAAGLNAAQFGVKAV